VRPPSGDTLATAIVSTSLSRSEMTCRRVSALIASLPPTW
jgi:hypothetical protein